MLITRPARVEHSYTQSLAAPPDEVFPLLCPVREAEWVNGWDPRLVVTESGVAERDCVFVIGPEDAESTWVVTVYEPPRAIGFLKFTPAQETVASISIELSAAGGGGTAAAVRYAYTALGPAGEAFVAAYTAAEYERFMLEWEAELNHFLRTGRKLESSAAGS